MLPCDQDVTYACAQLNICMVKDYQDLVVFACSVNYFNNIKFFILIGAKKCHIGYFDLICKSNQNNVGNSTKQKSSMVCFFWVVGKVGTFSFQAKKILSYQRISYGR